MTTTVHGAYPLPNGLHAAGSLLIEVDTEGQVIRDTTGKVVWTGPWEIRLFAGEATVVLPSSDDPGLAPGGFTFTVTERLDHVDSDDYRVVSFEALDGLTVELADVISEGEATVAPAYPNTIEVAVAALQAASTAETARAIAAELALRDLSDPIFAANLAAAIESGVPAALADALGADPAALAVLVAALADDPTLLAALEAAVAADPAVVAAVVSAVASDSTVIAAAISAVNTVASAGGLVSTANMPALLTNRLLDPRMTNTSKWTKSAGTFTFDGTGAAGALLVGTGGAILNFFPSVDLACSPGDVISAGAYFTLLSGTSANGRVSLLWFKSDGTSAGADTTGTNVALSATETRISITGTAPATAAKVRVAFYGRNMTGSANVRVRQGMVVTGSTLPAYFDGSMNAQGLGVGWTGTPDNSTSIQFAVPASEMASIRALVAQLATIYPSPVTLTKSGNDHTITSLLGASTLAILTRPAGSGNGAFNIQSATLDGVTVWNNGDDVGPIRTQNGFVGGNHGFANLGAFINPDGKTAADLGSVYHDTAGREYVLMGFESGTGKLLMGGSYTSPGGVVTYASVAPVTDLTWVSGGTHHGTIDHTTVTNGQLFPAVRRIQVSYWVDGKQIAADGTYGGRLVEVRETYDILDYASIYDLMKANVGSAHTALGVTASVRVSNTYRFVAGGRCRVRTELVEITPTTLDKAGGIQSYPPGNPSGVLLAGATRMRYIPGVGTVGGVDWTAGVNIDTAFPGIGTLSVTSSDAPNGAPFAMDVITVGGVTQWGWVVGYLPYGVRGDESSRNTARQTGAATALFELNLSMKVYPHFARTMAAGWGRLTSEAFRAWLTPTQVAAVLAAKDSPSGAFAALDAVKALTPAV